MYQGCDQILMSTLISKKLGVYKNIRNTVHINSIFVCVGKRIDCNFRNVPVSGFKKTSSKKIKIANFYLLFRVYLKKPNLPSLTLYDAMYVLTMKKNFCDYHQSSICLVSCHSNRLCSWFNLEDMHLKEHKFRLTYWCGKYVIWKKTTLRVFVAIWRWMSTMILIQWSKQEQIICWWLCNGYIQVRDHPYNYVSKGTGQVGS